jgi:hypothetical protein
MSAVTVRTSAVRYFSRCRELGVRPEESAAEAQEPGVGSEEVSMPPEEL